MVGGGAGGGLEGGEDGEDEVEDGLLPVQEALGGLVLQREGRQDGSKGYEMTSLPLPNLLKSHSPSETATARRARVVPTVAFTVTFSSSSDWWARYSKTRKWLSQPTSSTRE